MQLRDRQRFVLEQVQDAQGGCRQRADSAPRSLATEPSFHDDGPMQRPAGQRTEPTSVVRSWWTISAKTVARAAASSGEMALARHRHHAAVMNRRGGGRLADPFVKQAPLVPALRQLRGPLRRARHGQIAAVDRVVQRARHRVEAGAPPANGLVAAPPQRMSGVG